MTTSDSQNILNRVEALYQFKKAKIVKTNALRVINGAADGFAGLTADRYNNSWQIQVFDSQASIEATRLAKALAAQSDFVVIKWRTDSNGLALENFRFEIVKEGPSQIEVFEDEAIFEVDLLDAVNSGLFLDMRANRIKVKELANGRRVCNGFSYTCSFGVHTQLGGALETTNVDISNKILQRGQRNYELNQLPSQNSFVRADSLEFLSTQKKKGCTYDLIVMDPPTFARNKKGTFKVDRDLEKLAGLCLDCLESKGILFISTNCSTLSEEKIGQRLGDLARSRGEKLKVLFRVYQDFDFTPDPENPTSHLAGFCLEKR